MITVLSNIVEIVVLTAFSALDDVAIRGGQLRRQTCSDALSLKLAPGGGTIRQIGYGYLLRIHGALQSGKLRRGLDGSEENGLVLVHSRICEQKGRVRERDNGRRGHWTNSTHSFDKVSGRRERQTKGVAIFLEVIDEGISDSHGAPLHCGGRKGWCCREREGGRKSADGCGGGGCRDRGREGFALEGLQLLFGGGGGRAAAGRKVVVRIWARLRVTQPRGSLQRRPKPGAAQIESACLVQDGTHKLSSRFVIRKTSRKRLQTLDAENAKK